MEISFATNCHEYVLHKSATFKKHDRRNRIYDENEVRTYVPSGVRGIVLLDVAGLATHPAAGETVPLPKRGVSPPKYCAAINPPLRRIHSGTKCFIDQDFMRSFASLCLVRRFFSVEDCDLVT